MLVAALGASCGTAAGDATTAVSGRFGPEAAAIVGTQEGVALVDLGRGDVVARIPAAAGTPGWDRIFAVASGRLAEIDPGEGRRQRLGRVPRGLEAALASRAGDLVALVAARRGAHDPHAPVARSATRLAIADTASGDVRKYRLRGNFEPEAFSVDSKFLFLIEYLPAMNPDRYRVRRLHLDSGRVRDVGGRDKSPAPDEMRGTGRAQVYSPAGDVLYTLYTRQDSPGHGAPGTGDVYSFVHVLNLREGWAHCVDLPHPFGLGEPAAQAIAAAPDGSKLYVVDRSAAAIAEVDARSLRVRRIATAELGPVTGYPTAATAAPDGTLYVGGWGEIASFSARLIEDLRAPAGVVDDLAWLAPGMLLAASADGIAIVDESLERTRTSMPLPGAHSVTPVGRDAR